VIQKQTTCIASCALMHEATVDKTLITDDTYSKSLLVLAAAAVQCGSSASHAARLTAGYTMTQQHIINENIPSNHITAQLHIASTTHLHTQAARALPNLAKQFHPVYSTQMNISNIITQIVILYLHRNAQKVEKCSS